MSASGRKSRLNQAMQKKALLPDEAPEETTEDATSGPSLTLAPPPAVEPEDVAPDAVTEPTPEPVTEAGAEHAEETPAEGEGSQTPDAERSAVQVEHDEALRAAESDDEPDDAMQEAIQAAPVEEPVQGPAQPDAPPRRTRASAAPTKKAAKSEQQPPAQKARVRAGVGQIDLSPEMVHLRRVMDNGRDQRRYVEDLPRRSDKGTYMRLPIHLQDALSEYCDRNSAPMADFIAAVLDAYFRDIGLLPPLGEGHRPSEEFLDRLRKESRTYDY